jgi:hypothetical protein
MSLISWLRNPKKSDFRQRRHTRGASRQSSSFRPQLEALEDRCVPSTLTVTNVADDDSAGSLRYEIAQAQSNDKIVFNNALFFSQVSGSKKHTIQTIQTPQTIILTSAWGELVITKNLTIQGPGAGLLTITSQTWVDGAFNTHPGSRIFEVDGAGTTVALSGLTITGGGGTRYGGPGSANVYPPIPYENYGGAILNFGTLTISGCTLGGNTVVGFSFTGSYANYGGAVANFGAMTLTNCDVSNNHAYGIPDEGGGIYNAGTLTVSGSYVWFNSAGSGGGIYNAGPAAALTVSNSMFSSNTPDNIFGPYNDGGGNIFK